MASLPSTSMSLSSITPSLAHRSSSRGCVPAAALASVSSRLAVNGRRGLLKGVEGRGHRVPQRTRVLVRAKEDSTQQLVGNALKAGNQALDAAVQLLPPTIPKPVGKVGVGLIGLAISLSIIQAVFNSFITLLVLGGLGYAGFTYLSKGESTSKGEDPLDEARRIMDKYK